MIVGIGWGE